MPFRHRWGGERSGNGLLKNAMSELWAVEFACSLGLVQALLYAPVFLGPARLGAGVLFSDSNVAVAVLAGMAISFFVDNRTRGRRALTEQSRFCSNGVSSSLIVVGILGACSQAIASWRGPLRVLPYVGGVLMGLGLALTSVHIVHCLARLSSKRASVLVCAACGICVAMTVLFAAVCPQRLGLGVMLVLAGATGVLSHRAAGGMPLSVPIRPEPEIMGAVRSSDCWRGAIVAAVAAFTVVCLTVLSMRLTEGAEGVSLAAVRFVALVGPLAVAFVVFVVFCRRAKVLSLTLVYRIVLPATGIAVLVWALFQCKPLAFACCVLALVFLDWALVFIGLTVLRSDYNYDGRMAFRARSGQILGMMVALLVAAPFAGLFGADNVCLVCVALLMVAFVICVPTQEARFVGPMSRGRKVIEVLKGEHRERYAGVAVQFELTAREAEVLALLMDGLDNAGIAQYLSISRPTVNTHIQHIYTKCDVHSRSELAMRVGMPLWEKEEA